MQIPSFTEITEQHNGKIIFTSSRESITGFFGEPILNYEEACQVLVMKWLAQESVVKNPVDEIGNKTTTLNIQNEVQTDWEGFATVQNNGQNIIGKNFWFRPDKKYIVDIAPGNYFRTDPLVGREGLHIYMLFFEEQSGHAIGIRRLPSTAFAIYDPNEGACAMHPFYFDGFLSDLLKNIYPNAIDYALCSWFSDQE